MKINDERIPEFDSRQCLSNLIVDVGVNNDNNHVH